MELLKKFNKIILLIGLPTVLNAYEGVNNKSITKHFGTVQKLIVSNKIGVYETGEINHYQPDTLIPSDIPEANDFIKDVIYINYFNSLKNYKHSSLSEAIVSSIKNELYTKGLVVKENNNLLSLNVDYSFKALYELNNLLEKWYNSTFNKVYKINDEYTDEELKSTDRIYELRKMLTNDYGEILELSNKKYFRVTRNYTSGLTDKQSQLLTKLNSIEELYGGHHYSPEIKKRMIVRGSILEQRHSILKELNELGIEVIWNEKVKLWQQLK